MSKKETALKEGIKSLLSDRPVAYHPLLAKLFGGVNAGLFLSQILYWSDKGSEPDGWIYKSQKELEEETGMSRREQENARSVLTNKNVLEEVRRGLPARLYYRINWDVLIEELSNKASQSRLAETANLEWRKPPILNGGNRQSSYTESTAENTTENTLSLSRAREEDENEIEIPPDPDDMADLELADDPFVESDSGTLRSAARRTQFPQYGREIAMLLAENRTLHQAECIIREYGAERVSELIDSIRAYAKPGAAWQMAQKGTWSLDPPVPQREPERCSFCHRTHEEGCPHVW